MKRRLHALFLDYCVILGWLCALAAVAFSLHLGGVNLWGGPVDLVVFAASVLPVWLYLTITEAGAAHATWGKRRVGLRVLGLGAGFAYPVRVAVRNAAKLLPWQLAHLGVTPLLTGNDTGSLVSSAAAWLPITAAYALVGLTLVVMLIRDDRAALHDLIAGTRVSVA